MPPPPVIQDAVSCPGCRYELRGLGDRASTCPECGCEIDPVRLRLLRGARLRLGITLLAVCSPIAVLAHLLQASAASGGGNDGRSMFSSDWWLLLPASSAGLLGTVLVLQNGCSGLSNRALRAMEMLCGLCAGLQAVSAGMSSSAGGSVYPLSYFTSVPGAYFTLMDVVMSAANAGWQLAAISLLLALPRPASRVFQSLTMPVAARLVRRISILGWIIVAAWLLTSLENWAQLPFLTVPSRPPGSGPAPAGWSGEQPRWFREVIMAASAIIHVGSIAALSLAGLSALLARTHLGVSDAAGNGRVYVATHQPRPDQPT